MFRPQRESVVAMPPKSFFQAAYKRPTAAISAHTGQPSPNRAVLMGSSALATNGAALDMAHSPAEKPVTATTPVARAAAILRTAAPTLLCAALSRRRSRPVRASTTARTTGRNSLPMVICRLSQADPMPRREPASVSFIRAAISAAEPPPASSCLAYSAMAPMPSCLISSENPAMASSPTIIFMAAICSAVPMVLRPSAISPSTATGLRRLPALSFTVTPSF